MPTAWKRILIIAWIVLEGNPWRDRAGGATLTCRIAGRGLLNTCTVLNEAPARAGFGQAALALAPAYRMADTDQAGLATDGGLVAIPIRFLAPTQTGSRLRSVSY